MASLMAASWRMESGTLFRARGGRRRGAATYPCQHNGHMGGIRQSRRIPPCTAPLSSMPPLLLSPVCAFAAADASAALLPMNFRFGFLSTVWPSPSSSGPMFGPKSATARSPSMVNLPPWGAGGEKASDSRMERAQGPSALAAALDILPILLTNLTVPCTGLWLHSTLLTQYSSCMVIFSYSILLIYYPSYRDFFLLHSILLI